MDCPKCKKPHEPGNEFCHHCGYKLIRTDDTDGITNITKKTANQFGKKYILRTVIFIVIVGGIYAWSYFGRDSESTYQDLVSIGDFYCTDHHSAEADALAPSVDYLDDIARLELVGQEIDSMVVDETSQASVDSYNLRIEEYNVQFDELEAKIIATEGSIEDHNKKIDQYNNYLDNNCEKK